MPVGLGAWVGRPAGGGGGEERLPDPGPAHRGPTTPVRMDAEVDAERGLPTVAAEAEKPLGSADSPAELEGDEAQRLSQRASWVSRLLSRVARSSTGTRSSSQSRWTQRSLARSGGWEPFPEEKGGTEDFEHQVLAMPRLAHPRPRTMPSSSPDGLREAAGRLSPPPAITRFRSFDRLSEGTFGRVIIRGRSPGSRSNRKNEAPEEEIPT